MPMKIIAFIGFVFMAVAFELASRGIAGYTAFVFLSGFIFMASGWAYSVLKYEGNIHSLKSLIMSRAVVAGILLCVTSLILMLFLSQLIYFKVMFIFGFIIVMGGVIGLFIDGIENKTKQNKQNRTGTDDEINRTGTDEKRSG